MCTYLHLHLRLFTSVVFVKNNVSFFLDLLNFFLGFLFVFIFLLFAEVYNPTHLLNYVNFAFIIIIIYFILFFLFIRVIYLITYFWGVFFVEGWGVKDSSEGTHKTSQHTHI